MKKFKLTPITANTEDTSAAYQFGVEAFKVGMMRVPAYDMKNLAPLFDGKVFGYSTFLMDAWIKGWDSENLK